MRTVPCDYYADRRRTIWNWQRWKKHLTLLCVLLALAYAMSQLLGRFVHSDSMHNLKYELKSLHSKTSQLSLHIDNLNTLHQNLEKKLKECAVVTKPHCDKEKCPGPDKCTGDVSSLIKETVSNALATYDADDIGLADFALESAGGAVISTPNTESYTLGASPAKLLGIPLCYPKNSPQEMIKASSLPGECWAFKGQCGSAIIRLLGKVKIESISLEHIPPNISPVGNIDTAPREFSVWGLRCEKDRDGICLGNFMYNNKKKPVQNFKVQFQTNQAFEYVHIKFHSNYGNHNYTCVYRVRVHGNLVRDPHGFI